MKSTVPELEHCFSDPAFSRADCGVRATKTAISGLLLAAMLLPSSLLFGQQKIDNVPQIELASPLRDASSESPEVATGFAPVRAGRARNFMAVTAHPAGTDAAYNVLVNGGTVLDAAVAAQMVLNVVEPQSSGIGGGGFLLYYDAATNRVIAYDGRETAPAAADAEYLRYAAGKPEHPVQPNARQSGRSVGVPGLVRALALAHQHHGRLEWATLFEPAIQLAREGFPVSPRMAASLADAAPALARDPDAARLFLKPGGVPYQAGERWRNETLATTLESLAHDGADALYIGPIADAIVAKVSHPPLGATPGLITRDDLRDYQPRVREPVCTVYRRWEVCGFPPPSAGGIAVGQIMGMLQHFDLAQFAPRPELDVEAVHLITEAQRLAYADRDYFVGDPEFVEWPGESWNDLLEAEYLQARAQLIRPDRSMGVASPGYSMLERGMDRTLEQPETTHVSLVDQYGNALAMTTSIEGGFGSYMAAAGFLLNNQLTDFARIPVTDAGHHLANRVEGGKRPRSSMAPTLVFERTARGERGRLILITGSPGGGPIIQYVVRNLIALLDWNMSPAEAAALPHFGASNLPVTVLEEGHPAALAADLGGLAVGLIERGHEVVFMPRTSGLATIAIRRDADGSTLLEGGADPRREGSVKGG